MTSPASATAATACAGFERATPAGRAAWLLLASSSWAILGTARWLRPDARGFGTHRQLGLPPCTFELSTHVPCPGCGLTTSFAHMAHGHVLQAFRAHLMGPLLFALVSFVAVYGLYAIWRARPLRLLLDSRWSAPALLITASAGVLTFGVRLAHTLAAR